MAFSPWTLSPDKFLDKKLGDTLNFTYLYKFFFTIMWESTKQINMCQEYMSLFSSQALQEWKKY